MSVGTVGCERRIVNVAACSVPTDAVNLGQMVSAIAAANSQRSQASEKMSVALGEESAQRAAGGLALSNKVSALETSLADVDGRLEHLDQRIASSTATAVAMSGNAFLPDMKLNLAANAAPYDARMPVRCRWGRWCRAAPRSTRAWRRASTRAVSPPRASASHSTFRSGPSLERRRAASRGAAPFLQEKR